MMMIQLPSRHAQHGVNKHLHPHELPPRPCNSNSNSNIRLLRKRRERGLIIITRLEIIIDVIPFNYLHLMLILRQEGITNHQPIKLLPPATQIVMLQQQQAMLFPPPPPPPTMADQNVHSNRSQNLIPNHTNLHNHNPSRRDMALVVHVVQTIVPILIVNVWNVD